jgi:hypothetical protein
MVQRAHDLSTYDPDGYQDGVGVHRGGRAVGARQCGKTTLARELLSVESVNYFDLEDLAGRARLDEPMTALQPLEGLVVIDEAQLRPDLFPIPSRASVSAGEHRGLL